MEIKTVGVKDLVVGQIYCDTDTDVGYSGYMAFVDGDDYAVRFIGVGGKVDTYCLDEKGLIEFARFEGDSFYITPKCADFQL